MWWREWSSRSAISSRASSRRTSVDGIAAGKSFQLRCRDNTFTVLLGKGFGDVPSGEWVAFLSAQGTFRSRESCQRGGNVRVYGGRQSLRVPAAMTGFVMSSAPVNASPTKGEVMTLSHGSCQCSASPPWPHLSLVQRGSSRIGQRRRTSARRLTRPSNDFGAATSKDGLSLYFNSDRLGSLGGQDIWVSQRPSENDAWGPPMNLGAVINTTAAELYSLSRDGHWLFFTSTDPDAAWEMSYLGLAARAHPRRLRLGNAVQSWLGCQFSLFRRRGILF